MVFEHNNIVCTWCDKPIEEGQLFELDIHGDQIHVSCSCQIDEINDINNSYS